jgi:hypothetical protein
MFTIRKTYGFNKFDAIERFQQIFFPYLVIVLYEQSNDKHGKHKMKGTGNAKNYVLGRGNNVSWLVAVSAFDNFRENKKPVRKQGTFLR